MCELADDNPRDFPLDLDDRFRGSRRDSDCRCRGCRRDPDFRCRGENFSCDCFFSPDLFSPIVMQHSDWLELPDSVSTSPERPSKLATL